MNVNMVFEGAAVGLLGYGRRPRLPGRAGGLFTAILERVMGNQIGWPLPGS